MSLEASTGTTLDRRPAIPEGGKRDLIENPKNMPQLARKWCWAASIESAQRTIGKGVRDQHLIVADHLKCGRDACCTESRDCDESIDRCELQALWRNEGFSQMTYVPHTIDFEDVKVEIASKRLVLLEINNRHVILVYGWETDSLKGKIVHILDTEPDAPGYWNFDDLDGYDPWGPWTGTGLGIEYDGPATREYC